MMIQVEGISILSPRMNTKYKSNLLEIIIYYGTSYEFHDPSALTMGTAVQVVPVTNLGPRLGPGMLWT